MKKIVVLGVGKHGAIVVNEMIERKTEGVEFAIVENINAIEKVLDNTGMIFIVFKSLGEENNLALALEITKAAKLAEILTIAVPIYGSAEEEYIKKFKDFSDAIILSSKKMAQSPRRVYLNIEAIVSLIAQKRLDLDDMKNVFHNIGSVFIGAGYTEDCDNDSIYYAYEAALDQTPSLDGIFNRRNYIINISTDRKTDKDDIKWAESEINSICDILSYLDEQTILYDHVFDERLDGVYRVTLIVGMNDGGYRDYREMLEYEYFNRSSEPLMEHIKNGLTETEIVKYGSYTKLLETVLRVGIPELASLLISIGTDPKNLEKDGIFDEDILTDLMDRSDVSVILEIMNMLFDVKININKNLMKPFARSSNPDMAQILLAFINYGWNVNAHYENGTTILMTAVYKMSLECVKILVEHGAEINAKDGEGHTPLTRLKWRTQDEKQEIAEFMIENGAVTDIQS